jgi:hypothetical protein
LFHVHEGGHHGHPYNALGQAVQVSGIVKPLLRSQSALEGITYAPPGSLPQGYDDCLYVASFGDGHINRVRLQRTNDGTYTADMDLFAQVPSALGVIFSPKEKAIYACSHEQRKIYRITPK